MKFFSEFRKDGAVGAVLRPGMWRIWFLCILSVLLSVLQVGMALVFQYVIDAVLTQNGQAFQWTVLLIADLVLQVVVYGTESWFTGSTTDRFAADLRTKLMESAVFCGDSRLEAYHSGQLLSRGMEDVRSLCDGVVQALPALIGQITRLVAAFCAVLLIYPAVASVLVAAGTVVLAGVALLRPVLKKQQRAVRSAEEKVMSTMQVDLQQLELIQSMDIQVQILVRYGKQQDRSLRARFRQRCWSVSSNGIVNTASLLGTGALLLWGAGRVAAGVLSYGSLTALIQLLNQFRAPVLGLSGLWTRFVYIEVCTERLELLLSAPEDKPAKREPFSPESVVFENVTFCYQGEDHPVFENFSIELPLDGWTALGGFSGRGKSTLFKLMLGLYQPQQGRVYLKTAQGDIPCGSDTRHIFAYVPQDYALFSGTVKENLLLVAPDADSEKLRQVLELAKAEFVWEMTAGENTVLRENNTGLSKGQIQRLAIARAILMDRPVLLLDECTSALDADTENAVLHNLRSTGKAAILVTHRPEALEELDDVTAVSMEE